MLMAVVGSTRSLHVRAIEKSPSYCGKCGGSGRNWCCRASHTMCWRADNDAAVAVSLGVTPSPRLAWYNISITSAGQPFPSTLCFRSGKNGFQLSRTHLRMRIKRTRYLNIKFIVLEISLTVINPKRSLHASGGHALRIEVYGKLRHDTVHVF